MSKPTLESIEQLLSSIADDDLRAFVKAYALTHPTMFDAFRKDRGDRTSEEAVFDYASAVKRCYRHIMKTPRWGHDWQRQPEYLDWEEVGEDLRGVIKRAERPIAAGRHDVTAETALLILEMDDRQYEEDSLSEREDWDVEDLCLDACFTLMEDALDSLDPDTWAACRDRMLEKKKYFRTYADSPLAEIYLRKGLVCSRCDFTLHTLYTVTTSRPIWRTRYHT